MDILFVKKGGYDKGEDGYPFILEAYERYLEIAGPKDPRAQEHPAPDIETTPEGRPFIKGSDVDFSLSHSGDLLVLLFSEERCGADVEKISERDYEGIAERMFPEEDRRYLAGLAPEEKAGAFFDLWTRYEALGKYDGRGIFGAGRGLSKSGDPASVRRLSGSGAFMHSGRELIPGSGYEEVFRGFALSCVTGHEEPPVIKMICQGGEDNEDRKKRKTEI